jgi:excisionase family DNA binding protein
LRALSSCCGVELRRKKMRAISKTETEGDALVGGGLLTPEEAAGRLRIGRTFIYALLREGVIPSVKIGRARRVRAADLDAYVRSLLEEQG